MKIRRSSGLFVVSFEPEDWNEDRARRVIEGIKTRIGHLSRNPEGFQYSEARHEWDIIATKENKDILEELKREFIDDPNQERMFA